MAYYPRKKPSTRAKRNFKKWATGQNRARANRGRPGPKTFRGGRLRNTGINSNFDVLKVRMTRTITYGDMQSSTDGSRYCNLFFCPMHNVSTTFSGGSANLFYHPDFETMSALYQQYKVTCVVLKFSRPDIWIKDSTNANNQFIKMPTQEWGSQILHSRIVNKPDANTGSMQLQADLQPRVQIYAPASYAEAVDDGARRFKIVPNYKRTETRVYKPSTFYEKKWVNKLYDDPELAKGGMHLRIKKGNEPMGALTHFDQDPSQTIYDITATVYMAFKERI